jgi:toxin ParE1/3/4
MSRTVVLSREAKLDILEIWNYRAKSVNLEDADGLIARLEALIRSLGENPERGHYPPELERVDEYNYREINCVTYRIFYKVVRDQIVVHCVLGGRRDMQMLLYRRLIR